MYKIRKGRVVEASALGAVGDAGGHGRRQLDSRLALGAVFSLSREPNRFWAICDLRIHRLGAAGVVAVVPARLSVELSQDRHGGLAGRRRDRGQSRAASPAVNEFFAAGGGPYFQRRDLSVLLHLHHVRGDLAVFML